MADEILISESQQDVVQDGMDDVDAFIEYKKNSVPRELYDKVVGEKDKLKRALASGEKIEFEEDKPVNLEELCKRTYTQDISNLEYVKNVLKIREEMIKKGMRDPALPVGDQVALTDDHTRRMNKVAEGLKQMVDYADGDATIFLDTYQRNVVDPIIPKKRK